MSLAFTKPLMVDLFNDLYDAVKVKGEFDKTWKDAEKKTVPPRDTIKKIVKVKGEKKEVTKYLYEVTEPKCSLLARRVGKDHPLLRLLRDQVKLVIRTGELARKVYKVRAETGTSGFGESMWNLLERERLKSLAGRIGSV